MRNTRQRELILETLREMSAHPTADMVYEKVRTKMPGISLGTVYRNLDLMSQMGLITPLDLGERARRFDANTQAHHHVRCLDCGRTDDISVDAVEKVLERAGEASGYDVREVSIVLTGLCPLCRGKAEAENGG